CYMLPGGQVITIGSERFRCTESLFQPSLIGLEEPGLHEVAFDALMKCKPAVHSVLYNNVVLCGGSSMFPGLADRIQRELTERAQSTLKARVIAHEERKNLAWIGGSILASLPTFGM